ncbi:MAG: cyss: cysteine--trna ligase [Verrucomicrobiales bacterium]|nr:cyss: cysteine--trna ligase [Verrucomicrobiales bacterium]
MPLTLFDTMSRAARELTPIDGQTLRFYCCGPTVYGPAHIGNFRTFVLQDLFRRVVELGGVPTRHVRNLTDVDDKTIRVSQEQGQTLTDFTRHWTRQFHADCAALHCLPPHVEPGAVDHIPQQVTMIQELMAKGHAYAAADGSVYFKVASYPEYGRLSRLNERELKLGTSVADDEYEKDTLADFALWKARKPEDGSNWWPAPWGEGRPGWHLECSAMIREYLGDTFDLHSGGVDLVFPHHENEIAQSECCTENHGFAAHWFHITHLLVDAKKMSKSLGNLYTLADLVARGFTPEEVRYVLTAAHYSGQLNFTFDSLEAARQVLLRLARAERSLAARAFPDKNSGALPTQVEIPPPAYESLIRQDPGPFAAAWKALNHDLNTAEALGHVFTTLKSLKPEILNPEEALSAWRGLHLILTAFGITFPEEKVEEIPVEIRTLAEARWAARTAKNWAESDRLRRELDSLGWSMKDGREDYTLSRK